MGSPTSIKRGFKFSNLFAGLDMPLVLTTVAMMIFGLVVLYSASMPIAIYENYHPIVDVWEQGRWVLLGSVWAFLISFIDYRKLQPFVLGFLAVAIILLVLVLVIGEARHGAVRTLFNGRIQPSEITKVALILYLSFWLKSKQEYLKSLTVWILPIGIILGIIAVLIFMEPDYSALLTIMIISALIIFLANLDWWQAILIGLVGSGLFAVVIKFTNTGATRWNQFRTGLKNPAEAISQVQRTFESIVDGGIFGVGIGQGTVKFTGLEVGQTDTIFTIVAEEMGLFGILLVLGLFGMFLWRGMKIAQESQNLTGQLIAAGVTFWVVAEAFINIASLINLIPIGGNTLPFFSKGGSSLTAILTGIGFLLSVSRVNYVVKNNERSSQSAVVDMRWRDRRRSVSRPRGSAITR